MTTGGSQTAGRTGIHKHGFVRIATASPRVKVADCRYNAQRLIEVMTVAEEKGADVLVTPELGLTGYTCADLFQNVTLQRAALSALDEVVKASLSRFAGLLFVGLPLALDDQLFNCAAVIHRGRILGVVPKACIPTYKEFYEDRWFSPAANASSREIKFGTRVVPFGTDLFFAAEDFDALVVGAEICEDVWMPVPPSSQQALNGATVLVNLSASNELIGKADYRRQLVVNQSGRCIAVYAYASCGSGESTTDVVFGGHLMIAENGTLLAENERFERDDTMLVADVDLERIRNDRQRTNSFRDSRLYLGLDRAFRQIGFKTERQTTPTRLARKVDAHPFVPKAETNLNRRCEEIFKIQVAGLAKRLERVGTKAVTIGVSGGLDSTLALLVTCKAFDLLALPRTGIKAYTMPGFGTTSRTRGNAVKLMQELGVSPHEVDIRHLCMEEMKALAHKPFGSIDLAGITLDRFVEKLTELPPGSQDLKFENVQARMRTSILMNSGFVIGTGDVSELALGWCTYNADHMSMYNPNSSIPKTLVKFLVRWAALNQFQGDVRNVLLDIVGTEISPELLPAGKDGKIAQKTESVVGPYELTDFFLYYFLRFGMTPEKILFLADHAKFDHPYTEAEIRHWLRNFLNRFFNQQFKRSCLPDGPKVGSVSLSPRGDWRMPTDAEGSLWLEWATEPQNRAAEKGTMGNAETGRDKVVRALLNVDATNDFADYDGTNGHGKSLLPVPGGREIGPVIGALQLKGKQLGIYKVQGAVRDSHKEGMFNFAENNPGKTPYKDKVPDRDGVLTTVYPRHMIPGTWGWEWIEGVVPELHDREFRKGCDLDRDEFSAARPEVIAWLKEEGITHVDLVGLVLRICVGLTAVDLAKAGFKVRVIEDATRDLDIPEMAQVITEMKQLGVEFVRANEVVPASAGV